MNGPRDDLTERSQSERETQIYAKTSMWSLKCDANEPIMKQKQTLKHRLN